MIPAPAPRPGVRATTRHAARYVCRLRRVQYPSPQKPRFCDLVSRVDSAPRRAAWQPRCWRDQLGFSSTRPAGRGTGDARRLLPTATWTSSGFWAAFLGLGCGFHILGRILDEQVAALARAEVVRVSLVLSLGLLVSRRHFHATDGVTLHLPLLDRVYQAGRRISAWCGQASHR